MYEMHTLWSINIYPYSILFGYYLSGRNSEWPKGGKLNLFVLFCYSSPIRIYIYIVYSCQTWKPKIFMKTFWDILSNAQEKMLSVVKYLIRHVKRSGLMKSCGVPTDTSDVSRTKQKSCAIRWLGSWDFFPQDFVESLQTQSIMYQDFNLGLLDLRAYGW